MAEATTRPAKVSGDGLVAEFERPFRASCQLADRIAGLAYVLEDLGVRARLVVIRGCSGTVVVVGVFGVVGGR